MAMTYAEMFVRKHADLVVKQLVERIHVSVDDRARVVLLTLDGRHRQVSMPNAAPEEDQFRKLATAVDELLGLSYQPLERVT